MGIEFQNEAGYLDIFVDHENQLRIEGTKKDNLFDSFTWSLDQEQADSLFQFLRENTRAKTLGDILAKELVGIVCNRAATPDQKLAATDLILELNNV